MTAWLSVPLTADDTATAGAMEGSAAARLARFANGRRADCTTTSGWMSLLSLALWGDPATDTLPREPVERELGGLTCEALLRGVMRSEAPPPPRLRS